MTVPITKINELDGQLGIQSPSGGLTAVIGVCQNDVTPLPGSYGRIKDLVADKGQGPLTEQAGQFIKAGMPTLVVPCGQTTVSAVDSLVTTGVTGTSVVTLTAGGSSSDDYEAQLVVETGGTVGTTGIRLQYSLDGGRTLSPPQDLGTDTDYEIPGTIANGDTLGISFDFAAGTLVAGDVVTARGVAAAPNSTEVTAALEAIRVNSANVEQVVCAFPIDATNKGVIETAVAAWSESTGKDVYWIGNIRMPDPGETDAAYLLAQAGMTRDVVNGSVCYGAARIVSAISGRIYRRPIVQAVAPKAASVDIHVNIADIDVGGMPGVRIYDDNNNPVEHDERITPGADDAGFLALRTFAGSTATYVNRPLIFSPVGSDFQLIPHRRVINVAKRVLRAFFDRALNGDLSVDPTTGFILETEALSLEAGATKALDAALLSSPSASGTEVVLSRTDNILSTGTLNVEARVTPLAYPVTINIDLGFFNPALVQRSSTL